MLNQTSANVEQKIQDLNRTKNELYQELTELQKTTEQQADDFYNKNMEIAKNKLERSMENMSINFQKAKSECQENYLIIAKECAENLNKDIEIKKAEIEKINIELEKLNSSYKASIEARLREKEIKEKIEFYKLKLDPLDEADIKMLNKVKSQLAHPRVLSMVIWQTWFQKPLKALSNNILGSNEVCGIYKITNIETDECYVGQARDIAKRWAEHAKCGLDIDRPQGNKLYKSMLEYGLTSFTWELLEKCKPEELNEKERYYIDLYHSAEFGFNSTQGNK